MAGEGGKSSRKISNNSSDEAARASPDPRLVGGPQTSPRTSARSAVDEQQQHPPKRAKLDVSAMLREQPLVLDNCGNSSFKNKCREGMDSESDGAKMDDSSCVVGDCSTCGDLGFQTELFRCTKCCDRLQHTYCSNSYNPRKRWLIRLCNWCEAEAAASTASRLVCTGTPKHNQVQVSSRRDSSPWSSTGKVERSNAIESLLGAALRLPSAGFSSVEDLLHVEPNVSSSGKRRKPSSAPSFDSIEKARRSGPGGDMNSVKSSKRPAAAPVVKAETPSTFVAAGEAQRSSSSSLDNGGERRSRSPRSADAPSSKLKRSPAACAADIATAPASSLLSGRDVKLQKSETAQQMDSEQNLNCSKEEIRAGRASSCDSSEKFEQRSTITTTTTGDASGAAAGIDKAARRLSPSITKVRLPGMKSPRSPALAARTTHDERAVLEVSSLDNAAKMKRSNSSVDHAQKNRTIPTSRKESKENIASTRSPKASRSGSPVESSGEGEIAPRQRSRSVESIEKAKKSSSSHSLEKSTSMRHARGDSDEYSEHTKSGSAAGRSDCANGTQEQQQQKSSGGGGKDCSFSPKKSPTDKQSTPTSGRQLVRPSFATGKSTTPTPRGNADERVQKKCFNHKDSSIKLRRSSSKIAGFHNYRSLSDILC